MLLLRQAFSIILLVGICDSTFVADGSKALPRAQFYPVVPANGRGSSEDSFVAAVNAFLGSLDKSRPVFNYDNGPLLTEEAFFRAVLRGAFLSLDQLIERRALSQARIGISFYRQSLVPKGWRSVFYAVGLWSSKKLVCVERWIIKIEDILNRFPVEHNKNAPYHDPDSESNGTEADLDSRD